MKTSEHADRTEKLVGLRAEDIHKWIDGFFDFHGFEDFLRSKEFSGYDPYDHRKFRHCVDALDEAYETFQDQYTKEQIKAVFESHIKDDYNGYLPHREDFENGTFTEQYHDNEERVEPEPILSETELSDYFKGKFYYQRKKKDKKLTTGFQVRIVLPTILAIILFVSSVFIVILPVFKKNILERKKEMIKELTAVAISFIEYNIDLEKKGILSTEEAQNKSIIEIEAMRYGDENKDYFWITDMHPKMIMHPYRTDLKGQDVSDYKDVMNKSGKKLFVEFAKIVKAHKEGYVEYLWQWKDDQTRVVPKLSFVKGIPEWEWIIGTGVYINDVEEEIALLTKNIMIIFSFIAGILVLILTYVIFQSLRINNDLLKAEAGLTEAKDRYKALVEASNEGHILEVEGEIVYSNHTLQDMLGYSGKEISSLKVWKLLVPDSKVNEYGLELLSRRTMSGEFEAQVMTKTGEILDVVIKTARIFFLKKKGNVISIRKILRKKSNDLLVSYGGTQDHPGSIFVTKKVEEICRRTTTEEDKSITEKIAADTPVFEALELMKSTENDNLNVVDDKGKIIGIVGYSDIAMMYAGLPMGMLYEIENSENVGHVIRTLNRLPDLIKEMTAQGTRSDTLRETISKMYSPAIKLFIKISMKEVGEPPVKFAFLSLGSVARQEMTMFSDQDNALIFEDTQDIEKAKKYFIRLADKVCSKLNKAGYPFCPGGIMAVNPKWCLSLSEWKGNFAVWIENATPESILRINVFFDIRCDYGDDLLVKDLQEFIKEKIEQNPGFFIHFAQNCLIYKEPLNLLGRIKAESKDGAKTFNIKNNLIPIVNFGRLYALKNNITEPNTIKRLRALLEKNILKDQRYHEIVYVFNHLWHLRFYNQIVSHSELKKTDDELDLEQLTNIERLNLRNVLSEISNFQARISNDFLGGMI